MLKSDAINELAAALAKAQGAMEGAKKDSENPFFRSKYADLASVVEALRTPFSENGLAYVQAPVPVEGDRVCVETMLLHASGQWVMGIVELPVSKADAQGFGSALTYARRYGLQSIAGIAAEDDDGNAAVATRPMPKSRRAAVDKDDTAARPGVVTEAQAEIDTTRVFGGEPPEPRMANGEPIAIVDREVLLGKIKGAADKLKLPAKERAALWDKYVGGDPRKADPAALQDLLTAIRALAP